MGRKRRKRWTKKEDKRVENPVPERRDGSILEKFQFQQALNLKRALVCRTVLDVALVSLVDNMPGSSASGWMSGLFGFLGNNESAPQQQQQQQHQQSNQRQRQSRHRSRKSAANKGQFRKEEEESKQKYGRDDARRLQREEEGERVECAGGKISPAEKIGAREKGEKEGEDDEEIFLRRGKEGEEVHGAVDEGGGEEDRLAVPNASSKPLILNADSNEHEQVCDVNFHSTFLGEAQNARSSSTTTSSPESKQSGDEFDSNGRLRRPLTARDHEEESLQSAAAAEGSYRGSGSDDSDDVDSGEETESSSDEMGKSKRHKEPLAPPAPPPPPLPPRRDSLASMDAPPPELPKRRESASAVKVASGSQESSNDAALLDFMKVKRKKSERKRRRTSDLQAEMPTSEVRQLAKVSEEMGQKEKDVVQEDEKKVDESVKGDQKVERKKSKKGKSKERQMKVEVKQQWDANEKGEEEDMKNLSKWDSGFAENDRDDEVPRKKDMSLVEAESRFCKRIGHALDRKDSEDEEEAKGRAKERPPHI